MRRRSPPPTGQEGVALWGTPHGFHYLGVDLVPVGVVIQEQEGRRKGCHEGKHGPVGRVAVRVNVVHYATDEEGLVRGKQPYPEHEQDARYAVHGAKVGQIPELIVIGTHDY